MQMVVKDMKPIPDQAFRERVLFQENMAARNLLGMRDMPVFLGNAEVAEDISFGPFAVSYTHLRVRSFGMEGCLLS